MFCASIDSILNTILKNEKVILCRETAAAYLGLSNGWGIPLRFYTTNKNIINSAYIKGYTVKDLAELETVSINNVLCTSKEQTILDLLRYNSSIQEILESISNYYYDHDENLELLYQAAEIVDLREELDKYTEDAKLYYTE